ncbi:PilZ domain-containing protein [Sphingomonas floccifaciens]|uniref:PilZ domain-containing protein n=1 Tax=Sphingomonas floccifaciens TaxID=1844115 RepID=A0ABW4NBZ2_9SPHN
MHNVFEKSILADKARRRYLRVAQIGRRIAVIVDGEKVDFLLTNVSARGAAGRCRLELPCGKFFTFIFENGATFRGEVRWSSSGTTGVYFGVSLPSDVLNPPPSVRELVSRAPRYSVARRAVLLVRGARRACVVRNVSTTGMMLETVMPPPPGQTISLICGAFAAEGEVRWVRQNLVGIRFLAPIDLDEFEEQGMAPPIEPEENAPAASDGPC